MLKKKRSNLSSYLMLLPNLLLLAVLSIYPVIWAFQYMFYNYDGIHEKTFVGLQNFSKIFLQDKVFWNAVKNTFVYAGAKIILIVPLAFVIAMLLNNTKKIYGGIQAVIFSPTIMSSAVMGLVFYLLFNAHSGEFNRMLMGLNVISAPVNWLGKELAMATVVIVAIWGGVGNYMVYFLAGLQQIPLDIYESADLDGCSAMRKMFTITIPMLGPVLKIILMLALINAFQDMQSVMVLTEGGPLQATNVMFLYIYQLYYPRASGTFPQFGYGAAVSVVSAGIVGIVTIFFNLFAKKLDRIDE